MTIQILMVLLPTFFIGCICNELRWIGRMRRLRGKLGLTEAGRTYAGENLRPEDVMAVAGSDSESLRNLSQTLAEETTSVMAAQPSAVANGW